MKGRTEMKIRILKLKEEQGLPQWALAAKMGVDNSRFSGIITGRVTPTDDEIWLISRQLKCDPELLFPDIYKPMAKGNQKDNEDEG